MATPKLAYHKARHVYYARFDGKMIYFGKDYATAAQKFAETLARWQNGEPVGATSKQALTVVEAVDRYLVHCTAYYGADAPDTGNIRRSLQRLCALYGREPLADLSPKKLKTLQQHLVQQDCSRYTINKVTSHVKRFAKWCVSEELAPESVYSALCTVPGLRKGKTKAREPEPAHVPSEDGIRVAAEHMPGDLGDALLLQYLTGSRPSELLGIRPMAAATAVMNWPRAWAPGAKTAARMANSMASRS